MAAFTADANHFSLRSGGQRMGFADPFLYHQFTADPGMFHDVKSGNNSILGGGTTTFPAGAGYDLATGLGSINVNTMATLLAAYTRSAVHIHGTKITASASVNPVTAGASDDPVGQADRHHVPHRRSAAGSSGSRGSSASRRRRCSSACTPAARAAGRRS